MRSANIVWAVGVSFVHGFRFIYVRDILTYVENFLEYTHTLRPFLLFFYVYIYVYTRRTRLGNSSSTLKNFYLESHTWYMGGRFCICPYTILDLMHVYVSYCLHFLGYKRDTMSNEYIRSTQVTGSEYV